MQALRSTLTVLALCPLIGSCRTSPPPNLYLLTPVAPTNVGPELPVKLRIGEVELPSYLSGQAMLVHETPHHLSVHENERWAEPLRETFPRILVRNLSRLMPGSQVTQHSWGGSRPDYELSVNVLRLSLEKTLVILEAQWRLSDGAGFDEVKTSAHVIQVTSPTFEAYAIALSQASSGLAEAISRSLTINHIQAKEKQ